MTWLDRLRTIQEQGGSLRGYHVILPSDILGIMVSASEGNPEALEPEQAIFDMAGSVGGAPRGAPMRCICCPRQLRADHFAIVVVSPERPGHQENVVHGESVAFAVCRRCGGTRDRVTTKAQEILQLVWPGARRIDLPKHGPAGRG